MKKLSIILLALALAASFAVPVMAGDISADGSYMLRGRHTSNTITQDYFQHELDLNLDVTSGNVKFHWDVELADKDLFDGTGLNFNRTDTTGDLPKGIWDGFYVQWQATDMLAFKAGIYGVSDNNTLMFYSAGNGDGIMGVKYKLDVADLGAYLSKQVDDHGDDNNDTTEMLFTAAGDLGPVAASLMYGTRTQDATPAADDSNAIYVDAAFDAGPVGVNFAYGSLSADDDTIDGGTIMLLNLNLMELVGFDLGLTSIITNADWQGTTFGNDYGYGELLDYDDVPDQTMISLEAGYKFNDKASVSGFAVVSNDEGDAGDGPLEMDVTLAYQFEDNVKYRIGYANVAAGDDTSSVPEDINRLWHRIDFKF